MPIDLTGKSFDIAQSVISKGQALNLDFSVMNSGDEDVAPFSFDIVISKDDEISEDDFRLGTYDIITGLKAGQGSGLKSYRYSTPAKDDSFWKDIDGNYTVGIRLDPKSEFFESNKDNNSNVGLDIDSDQVEVRDFDFLFKDQRAELKGKSISVANQEITPGEKIDLSFVVENESPAIANPFSIDVYLSPGIGIGVKGAVKLGTYDIRDITKGNGDTGVKSFKYPTPDLGDPVWEKGDGNYYIALDIDSKDEVEETKEGNNSRQEGLDVTGFDVTGLDTAADLVVKNFEAPANAKAGDTVSVEYEIVNEGGTEASLFAAGFYLFGDNYLADNESFNLEDVPEIFPLMSNMAASTISLEAGQTTGMMTTEITLPESWAGYSGDGDYYLGVEADPDNVVAESSDINNSLTEAGIDYQAIALEAPNDNTVDLVGTHFEVVQDQIVPGQEFDLGFTIKNEGLATTNPFIIDLYLSQDENISAEEDVHLGSYDIRDGLDGKEDTGLKSIRYTAPDGEEAFWDGGDGTYYAGMIIDPNDDIVESNEDNNSNQGMGLDYASTNVTGLEKIADLEAKSFDVKSENIEVGSDFEVSYEIINNGTESADLFGAGFFIFNEDYLMNGDALSIDNVSQAYFLKGDFADATISLEAGESTDMMTTTLTMPENWAGFAGGSGDYYVGLATDVYGDTAESNEMNNSLMGMDTDYQMVTINVPSMDI